MNGGVVSMPAPKARMRIGCAGWSISAVQRGLFGEGETALERYATVFNAAEINSSFYRPHQAKTYERWAQSVPRHFQFSVKAPKSISHEARLQGCGPLLDRFIGEVEGLGTKLGGILVQLPPSLEFDSRVASTFFAMVGRRTSAPIVCEPRHRSWFEDKAGLALKRYEISRAAADPAITDEAAIPGSFGRLRYWRWHGSPRMYYSSYGEEALVALANQVRGYLTKQVSAWVIFDNTAHGQATTNAARLQALLSADVKGKP